MVSAILATGICCFAAALFAQAGWGKLTKPAAYVETVAAYTGRPATASWVVAIGVSELLLALALLLPASRMWGVAAGGLLLSMYAVAMMRQVLQGQVDLKCGCSGPAAETRVSVALVIRNLVVAGVLLLTSLMVATPVGISGWSVGVAMALLLGLCYAATDQLIANQQHMAGVR